MGKKVKAKTYLEEQFKVSVLLITHSIKQTLHISKKS